MILLTNKKSENGNPSDFYQTDKMKVYQKKQQLIKYFTSRFRFKAHADRRHCSVTFSMPLFLALLKL